MKKRVLLCIVGLLIVVLLGACASKSNDMAGEAEAPSMTYATTTMANKGSYGLDETKAEYNDQDGLGNLGGNIALSNRKVILNANLSMEVDYFDEAYAKIKTMIAPYGYVQETSISKDKYYPEGSQEFIYVTRGVIVIRIDSEKFEQTMENISGIGTILDENRGSDDITYQYTDTEARIRLLEDEKGRLEKYLKDDSKDADFVFRVQSRLTDVLYQIENLKGNIQKWDDLISLSTITINMREKIPGQKPIKEYTYWDKFVKSFKTALRFCGDIIIFILSAVPVILILGALVVIVLFAIKGLRRIPGKKQEKIVQKPHQTDSDNDHKES